MFNESKDQFGRFFEQFRRGDTYRHWPGKTITESDNNIFCLLTMNHHPVHLDAEFCKAHQYGRQMAVGTYVFSLVVGLSVRDMSGKAIANLQYENVIHLAPVFIGDTLYAESIVLNVRKSKTKPDRGIVKIETRAKNQDGKDVLCFQRSMLIPKRPP